MSISEVKTTSRAALSISIVWANTLRPDKPISANNRHMDRNMVRAIAHEFSGSNYISMGSLSIDALSRSNYCRGNASNFRVLHFEAEHGSKFDSFRRWSLRVEYLSHVRLQAACEWRRLSYREFKALICADLNACS